MKHFIQWELQRFLNTGSLATCHSHDPIYLYSSQEQSFSYKQSFYFDNYVSVSDQFGYEHDIMNKSNIFTLSLINETSWNLQKSIVVEEIVDNSISISSVNNFNDKPSMVTKRDDINEMVHRTYGFITLTILVGGRGGRVVALSPPTSEAGVRFPAWPQVGKLVVACRWSAVYSTEP